MARQASEIRTAIPFLGLGSFDAALDGVSFEVRVDDDVIDGHGSDSYRLEADRYLRARCRIEIERDFVRTQVEHGVRDAGILDDSVAFMGYATAPTLKQTELIHPTRADGRVLLEPANEAERLPAEIEIDRDSNSRLFYDVSGGFAITCGFVLAQNGDAADALTPRTKGTWLARKTFRVVVTRPRTGSYELHELTPELRRVFGLSGRPLHYVRQVDDAESPLVTASLDEFVEIFVDADLLPLLRSERPGAATRFVASQIAVQVHTLILSVGARDLENGPPVRGSVFDKATRFLSQGGHPFPEDRLREWLVTDPGRFTAMVQARLDQVGAAEALLAS